jgi:HPt (histidine-containing phosphotransfer) domain-containing protein
MEVVTLDRGVLASIRQLTMPGEPDVLQEVLTTFLTDVPRRLEALAEAAAGGRSDDVARGAHSLKGSAGNIGARRLQRLATDLEDAARQGQVSELHGRADAVRREFAALESEIRQVLSGASFDLPRQSNEN